MVKKSERLKHALAAAKREATSRGFVAEDWRSEDLIRETQQIVEDLFLAIQFDRSMPDERANFESIDEWAHRDISARESDQLLMRFDRASFRVAADKYLDRPWMRDDSLDWFIVDALTYAELIATMDFIIANTSFLSKYAGGNPGSSWKWMSMTFAAFGWAATLLLLALAFLVHWALFVGLVAVSCILRSFAYLRRLKLRGLVRTMENSYLTLADEKPSWRLVWEEFKTSRESGVVWDTVAYRLVESRLRGDII